MGKSSIAALNSPTTPLFHRGYRGTLALVWNGAFFISGLGLGLGYAVS